MSRSLISEKLKILMTFNYFLVNFERSDFNQSLWIRLIFSLWFLLLKNFVSSFNDEVSRHLSNHRIIPLG